MSISKGGVSPEGYVWGISVISGTLCYIVMFGKNSLAVDLSLKWGKHPLRYFYICIVWIGGMLVFMVFNASEEIVYYAYLYIVLHSIIT